jgi:hypothetical protein
MKKKITTAGMVVFIAHVLIGGWAFTKLLEPGFTIDMLRLFALC